MQDSISSRRGFLGWTNRLLAVAGGELHCPCVESSHRVARARWERGRQLRYQFFKRVAWVPEAAGVVSVEAVGCPGPVPKFVKLRRIECIPIFELRRSRHDDPVLARDIRGLVAAVLDF